MKPPANVVSDPVTSMHEELQHKHSFHCQLLGGKHLCWETASGTEKPRAVVCHFDTLTDDCYTSLGAFDLATWTNVLQMSPFQANSTGSARCRRQNLWLLWMWLTVLPCSFPCRTTRAGPAPATPAMSVPILRRPTPGGCTSSLAHNWWLLSQVG
jgi:hypothetical protein